MIKAECSIGAVAVAANGSGIGDARIVETLNYK